jgi:hypothetical protein
LVRRTVEGTSATVATKSQMRPLRTEVNIRVSQPARNVHHRTCFQRTRVIPNAQPDSRRRRSKPKSMMRSNAMSVTSVPTTLTLVRSNWEIMHVFASGDHVERTYGLLGKASRTKSVKTENSFTCTIPVDSSCIQNIHPCHVGGTYNKRGLRRLPSIRSLKLPK